MLKRLSFIFLTILIFCGCIYLAFWFIDIKYENHLNNVEHPTTFDLVDNYKVISSSDSVYPIGSDLYIEELVGEITDNASSDDIDTIMEIILYTPNMNHKYDTPKIRKIMKDEFKRVNPKLTEEKIDHYLDCIYMALIHHNSKVHPFEIAAIIIQESTGYADAEYLGNYGLMQVNWRLHNEWARYHYPDIEKREDLYIPEYGIGSGVMIYNAKRNKYKSIETALKRYNGAGPVKERKYAEEVIRRIKKFETNLKKEK